MSEGNKKLPIENLSVDPHPNLLSLSVSVLDDEEQVVQTVVAVPGTEALQVYPTIESLEARGRK